MYAFRNWVIFATASAIALTAPSARADDKAAPAAPSVVTTDQVRQQDANDPFESRTRARTW